MGRRVTWVRVSTGVRGYLGFPPPRPRSAPARPIPGRNGRMRRWGRALVVRGLAQVAFRPGWWGAGVALVAFAAPGPWWFVLTGVGPLALYRYRSMRPVGAALPILQSVSRRVKSLLLRRLLLRSWTPLMVRLGLSQATDAETLVPHLGRVRLGEFGVSATVNLQRLALPVSALSKFSEHIESGLPVNACSISKIGKGLATMDLRHTDPLGETVPVDRLPAPTRRLHVVPQLAEDGRGVEQPLPPLHLTVGATRAGKSVRSWVLIKLILDAGVPLRVRIFDPKRQEWPAMAGAAWDYESDVTRWPAFLGRAFDAMRKRQASLAARGITELRRFTDSDPLDLLILDEFLSVLPFRNHDVKLRSGGTMKAHSVLDLYASQCLAAGYGMEAAAQLGQKEVIGSVRDLFPAATVLRVPPQAAEMVDAVLGPGAKHLHPAHEIPAGRHTAGIGYTRTPSGVVLRTRVGWLDDAERAEVVRRVREETQRLRALRKRARTEESEMAEASA